MTNQLRAFEKTELLAPEGKEIVTLRTTSRDRAHWHIGQRTLEAGSYLIGTGQHIRAIGNVLGRTVDVEEVLSWPA